MNKEVKLISLIITIVLVSVYCTKKEGQSVQPGSNVVSDIKDTLMAKSEDRPGEKYIYIDSFEVYKNIEQLINLKEFKNNVLYIDMWGIGCGPCIKEFQFSKELKERYKEKPIKFIYLADGPQKSYHHTLWKSIINKHELYGYHMPINSDLLRSIMSIKGYKAVGTLPHYILVNKNGEIVNPNAQRPSSGEKLYSQIDALL
jgi:thiol-disulfide isomerase/thioredoxin